VQLTWQLAPQHQLRLRFQKEVGQLNFGDFVASTEVNLGTVVGGNAELVPQKATIFEAVYEYRFWEKGALELMAQHRLVQDIIDVIPLEGGFEAVGNIGDGTRQILQAKLSLPMDRLGLTDALLQARGSWNWSRATDPLTGLHRRFSGEVPFGCGVNFNHDLKGGRYSYGFDHGCNVDDFTNYRIREIRYGENQPYFTVYGQWKPSSDLTIRLDVANITNARQRSEREIYGGRRDLSPLLFREIRSIRQGEWLFLQIRKVL
jgi:outer membrane receptor protein involved in Fe transport